MIRSEPPSSYLATIVVPVGVMGRRSAHGSDACGSAGCRAPRPRSPCRARTPPRAPSRHGARRASPRPRARPPAAPSRSRPRSRAGPASRTPGSRTGSRSRHRPQRDVTGDGDPRSRITCLKMSLSMHSADAEHAGADVRDVASSSRPCTVPSSPNGPWRRRRRRRRPPASRVSRRPAPAASPPAPRGQLAGARPAGEAPNARRDRSRSCARRSAPDRAPRRSRLRRRARSRARSTVRRRARPRGRGRSRGVDGVRSSRRLGRWLSGRRLGRRRRTCRHLDRDRGVGLGLRLPSGLCDATSPSSDSSSVSEVVTVTLKPAALRVCRAEARSSPVTSGTSTVVGPFDTDRVTVDLFAAVELPARVLDTTVPVGSSLSTSVRGDRELGRLELRGGGVVQEADDRRHPDGLRALGDVDADLGARDERRARRRGLRRDGARRLGGVDLH